MEQALDMKPSWAIVGWVCVHLKWRLSIELKLLNLIVQGDCGLDVSDGRSYRLRWQLCINLYSITSFCWKVVLMMVDSDEDGDDDNDEGDSKVRM